MADRNALASNPNEFISTFSHSVVMFYAYDLSTRRLEIKDVRVVNGLDLFYSCPMWSLRAMGNKNSLLCESWKQFRPWDVEKPTMWIVTRQWVFESGR